MGRLVNGLNGPIIGKVGAVVGSMRKGKPYLKGPYKKRTKKVSKKELGNRGKFAMAQFWLKPLLDFVRQGFKGYSETAEGFVAAKSWLLRNSFEGEGSERYINPALVKLSHGDLPLSGNITVERSGSDHIQFTWDTDSIEDTSGSDQVMMLAHDIKNEKAHLNTTGQFRNAGSDTLKIYGAAGNTYHIYAAFVSADRSRQSDSVYLGEISFS